MRRLPLVVGLTLSCLALPSPALADDESDARATPTQPPPTVTESTAATIDSVYLRSGGMFRGRVTEIVPGSHVQVKLENGESKRLPWSDVDRVIVASTSVPPPPNATKLGPAPKSGPMARVHINAGGHQAFLIRQPAGTSDWETACQSPCDQDMPLGDTYKIAGTGFRTTKEFKLDAEPGGGVELSIDGPNWFGIIGGGAMTIAGVGAAYGGLLVAAAGSSCGGSSYDTRCDGTGKTGLAVAGVGVGLIVLGLLIVYPSLKTDLEQERDRPSKDAFVRTPSWRAASAAEQGAPVTLPFSFSRSF